MSDTEIAFHCFETAERVAAEAARRLLAAAREAIEARGRFRLVLAGGRTPLATYTLLVDHASDWDRWHIFFGDERCVAKNDPNRNSLAISRAFLDRVPIPAANRHPIPAELGAEEAARRYDRLIRDLLSRSPRPFDLVLLGLGEDGHTASLFPGRPIPDERLAMPVYQAPKPPPERVSLTPRALGASRACLILATGEAKREALRAWRAGENPPIARVVPAGTMDVLMDRAAAGTASPCSDSLLR